MAITDYKITDGEITQRNVKSAPDVLSDTPNNNKAVFDNLTEHFIGKYNDLIDNINSDFVDSSEFAEGLTVSDKVRWRYALTKGTSIGLNFSGNITQITTGFRTIVGDIDGLTETDFMDCYLSINGTDYECGDSYASGNSILTSAVINGVTVEIIYDTTNGNITLEHTTNPLDTLYWNVSIYRSVAEKVPRKALPATVSNDGYTELKNLLAKATERFVTVTGQLTIPATSGQSVFIDVDNDQKVQVLSVCQNTASNANVWRGTANMNYNDTAYPTYAKGGGHITINLYNEGSSQRIVKYQLTYMVAE